MARSKLENYWNVICKGGTPHGVTANQKKALEKYAKWLSVNLGLNR